MFSDLITSYINLTNYETVLELSRDNSFGLEDQYSYEESQIRNVLSEIKQVKANSIFVLGNKSEAIKLYEKVVAMAQALSDNRQNKEPIAVLNRSILMNCADVCVRFKVHILTCHFALIDDQTDMNDTDKYHAQCTRTLIDTQRSEFIEELADAIVQYELELCEKEYTITITMADITEDDRIKVE